MKWSRVFLEQIATGKLNEDTETKPKGDCGGADSRIYVRALDSS